MPTLNPLQSDFLTAVLRIRIQPKGTLSRKDSRARALDDYRRREQKVLDEIVKLRDLYHREDLAAAYEAELKKQQDLVKNPAGAATIEATLKATFAALEDVKKRARKDVADLSQNKDVARRAAATPAPPPAPPAAPAPRPAPARDDPAAVLAKARDSSGFTSALKAARDRLWEASNLPYVTAPKVKESIAAIKKLIDEAEHFAVPHAKLLENLEHGKAKLAETAGELTKAKAASAAEAKKFEADLAATQTYFDRLALAEKKLRELKSVAGTSAARDKMAELIATAKGKLTGDAALQRGFTDAVEVLKGYEALVAKAGADQRAFEETKQTNPSALSAQLPELTKTKVALATLKTDFPPQASLFEPDLTVLEEEAVLAHSARKPTDGVTAKLTALAARINQAHADQTRLQGECSAKMTKLRADLDTIRGWASPDTFAPVANALTAAREATVAKDFSIAQDHLGAAEARLKIFLDLGDDARKWQAALETAAGFPGEAAGMTYNVMLERSRAMQQFPPARYATYVVGELPKLKASTEASLKFDEGIKQLMQFGKDVKKLWDKYVGAGDPARAAADFKAYTTARTQAIQKVDAARNGVLEKLAALEKALAGVKNTKTTDVHKEYPPIWARWEDILATGADPEDEATDIRSAAQYLSVQATTIAGDLNTLRTKIEPLLVKKTLGKNAALEAVIGKAKVEDTRIEDEERLNGIPAQLEKLEQLGGNAREVRAEYLTVKALSGSGPKEVRAKALDVEIKKKIAEREAALTALRVKSLAKKRALDTKMAALAKAKGAADFKEYLDGMGDEIADLNVLINSADPDLIRQAEVELDKLQSRADSLGDTNKVASYQKVKETWTKLARDLGNEDVTKFLKDTQARLRTQLEAAIAAVKAMTPLEGLARLEPLEKPIADAVALAKAQKALHAGFVQRLEAVEAQHAELRRASSTRMTDRTTSYNDQLESRFAELKTLALTEGGIAKAVEGVNAIAAELQAMKSAPDPRMALQQADTKAAQAHTELKAMVEAFKAAMESFEKVDQPAAKAAVKAAGDEGDTEKIDDLDRAREEAAKIVDKYRAMFSYKPTDWLSGGMLTPQQHEEAKKLFLQAQNKLALARQAARWLTDNPAGNKVRVRSDLSKVNEAWKASAGKFARAITELGRAVKTEGEAEGVREDLKEMVKKVLPKLLKARTTFDPEAFESSVAKLVAEKSKKPVRQAAREEALRVVRRYRKLLVIDPLLKAIRGADNTFHKVQVESGMLRAALKNLEITILASV